MKHLKSYVDENGENVIKLSVTDLKRMMSTPSNAVEHYHPLKIVEGVARRICEKGYHRLSSGYSAPPDELLCKISPLERKILFYNAVCSVCSQTYFDAETERHSEGPVLVPDISYDSGLRLLKINESPKILDMKKENLPKRPELFDPRSLF